VFFGSRIGISCECDEEMTSYPHVALIVATSKQYDRGLLRGIGRYIKGHGPWSVFIEERGANDATPAWLRTWRGDGIIARIRDRAMADALLATGAPIVELRREVDAELPTVYCDDAAIADLGVRHFKERGYRQFAFCGWSGSGIRWSDLREHAYRSRLAELGHTCDIYKPASRSRRLAWEQEQDDVARWLDSLPKPVAILTGNDLRGLQVLDACRRIDLAVPERAAVLGVDNDVVLCELSDPPLSSIDQDLQRIGYEAAALLDRLMGGEAPPDQPILVAPQGIISRLSTDVVAFDDSAVAIALRLIRRHACDHIGLDDLAHRSGLSRRVLQRRFKAATGRTVQEEILDNQLNRIKQLLAETDTKLESIARKSGFEYIGYMCSFFKKRTGMTPGEYRAIHSQGPRPDAG
jgi:LacI family transcriptional regulator